MRAIIVLLSIASFACGQDFTVIHKRTLRRDAPGSLHIDDTGITFTAERPSDSRMWAYTDIQYFDRISKQEFTILTYEDQERYLGRDHQYHFMITEGELTDSAFQRISARLGRPVTNRVVPREIDSTYVISAKHLHTLGGCEGQLKFTPSAIYYVTGSKEDAREWLLERDVQSVWSGDPYHLEIHVYDNNRREFSRTRVYKFDLKTALDPEFYRSLKLKMYDLETTHLMIR